MRHTPKDGTVQQTVKIPAKVYHNLEMLAEALGVSVHGLCIRFIEGGHDAILSDAALRLALQECEAQRRRLDAESITKMDEKFAALRSRFERALSEPLPVVQSSRKTEARPADLEYEDRVRKYQHAVLQADASGGPPAAARVVQEMRGDGSGHIWRTIADRMKAEGKVEFVSHVEQALREISTSKGSTEVVP